MVTRRHRHALHEAQPAGAASPQRTTPHISTPTPPHPTAPHRTTPHRTAPHRTHLVRFPLDRQGEDGQTGLREHGLVVEVRLHGGHHQAAHALGAELRHVGELCGPDEQEM